MGRWKIECGTKREKMDFRLGGTQEEGESKVLPPSRRHKESMCKSKESGSRTRIKRKESSEEEAALRKRRQPRESCAWRKKIKRRE